MANNPDTIEDEKLDTSDVDKYIGQRVAGGQLKEPINITDIRRWMMALDYYNPIHFEEHAATERASTGRIIAPQSFAANCCVGHGSIPAITGNIPGSHVVFGGDEWWFYGPHIEPGDKIHTTPRFAGYKISNTKFAGPVMFSHGDTVYRNQRDELVCKQRCTMGRYRVDLAQKLGFYDDAAEAPVFSEDQLAEFKRLKGQWLAAGAGGSGPGEVRPGDLLPTRPIGPHSAVTFTKEYSSLLYNAWGGHNYEDGYLGAEAGWIPEMTAENDDPTMQVGQDDGPASAHTDINKAKLIGLPRLYGYGSSMGAWTLDYLAYWAGDGAFIRHAKFDYRSPTFEGDIAIITGEVQDVKYEPLVGADIVTVKILMANQDDVVLTSGYAQIQLSSA
ncbi:MAG: MaoC family dehydratase N-terminal domain-containing protein [Novosphingobium sp.]|nr:MaoC family dehydratase N-terminal domain-containing protein [Novosphingobium sp.]